VIKTLILTVQVLIGKLVEFGSSLDPTLKSLIDVSLSSLIA